MVSQQIQDIVMIGAGKLATHLGLALHKQGLNILQVYNRAPGKGQKLAARIGATFTDDILEINTGADLYILAVSDSYLDDLASVLQLKDRLVVHASGTVSMEILAPISSNTGVFYPVQTFSQNRRIDFRKIPVCIEGNSADTVEKLTGLAQKLTRSVYSLDTEKRRMLHLAAVFASNFTNFIYAISEELLKEQDISFKLLEPLILQTAGNVRFGHLLESQTGPAVRGDLNVLGKHHELLAGHPDYLEIYKLISANIIKHTSVNGKL